MSTSTSTLTSFVIDSQGYCNVATMSWHEIMALVNEELLIELTIYYIFWLTTELVGQINLVQILRV